MSEPFVGQIKMFAGNFAPRGWAYCDGQLLAVSQNDALFNLLGTIYGGDGRTTFGLPDLRGRIPIHAGGGAGPGLSPRALGAKSGVEEVTLTQNQLPIHGHPMKASADAATTPNPASKVAGETLTTTPYIDDTPASGFHANAVTSVGGSQSHNNMMPFLAVHFIIALFGIYPSRH